MDKNLFELIEKRRSEVSSHRSPDDQHSEVRSFFENRICLTINEFAVGVGLSPKSVERLIKRGEIRSKRVGRRVLIPAAAIEAWLTQKE